MLGFAQELAELLTREGFEVVTTRQDDSFIPLERRMTIAERVVKNGSAAVDELVELTGVSAMTVRREVDRLADRGLDDDRRRAVDRACRLFRLGLAGRPHRGGTPKHRACRFGRDPRSHRARRQPSATGLNHGAGAAPDAPAGSWPAAT